jgi:uncharacterized coiled-coil protein SlyX
MDLDATVAVLKRQLKELGDDLVKSKEDISSLRGTVNALTEQFKAFAEIQKEHNQPIQERVSDFYDPLYQEELRHHHVSETDNEKSESDKPQHHDDNSAHGGIDLTG